MVLYVSVYVCMLACMYVHMYIYTHMYICTLHVTLQHFLAQLLRLSHDYVREQPGETGLLLRNLN